MASMNRLGSLLEFSIFSIAQSQINNEVGSLGQIINESSLVSLLLLGCLVSIAFFLFIRENA